ncbi:hypothetical protein H9660_14245 [Clostridium sp. Sa3CUN1]|uniref:Uncharacterized protein n=1 Tax=Clostridium gallinarum TaxID=2762246 RepID=A0ABR8Q7D8_9CLOT|nr:hypothetical protein [Clostridium gallinarum]MBD7916304.1 hypothetical protein [Clostridium gallinarum]
MKSKVELIYENNEYIVSINGSVVDRETDIDKAFDKFKSVINNNKTSEARAWEDIVNKFEALNNDNLEINNEFRTMTYGDMKYFYNMGKVFYMANGQMIPLIGGYSLFKFNLSVASEGSLEKANDFTEFCKDVILEDISYRVTDSSIIVSSASFNYGSAEYNFMSEKINKGASIIKGSFKDFKEYVLSVIK